ncbi:hypothetical protein TNCT1_23060 [Streptomyces sp. 1-11]|nr:hypothetical protein TNCT1_23060 [Streptomyces sp. 1-11]
MSLSFASRGAGAARSERVRQRPARSAAAEKGDQAGWVAAIRCSRCAKWAVTDWAWVSM